MGKIYLYTSVFPFGNVAEAFVKNELNYIGENKLVIVPTNKDRCLRHIPANVEIDKNICNRGIKQKIQAVCSIVSPRIIFEVIKTIKTINKLSYFKDLIKYLYAANLVYYDVKKRADRGDNDVFYSYWLSYAPIAFALYKSNHLNTSCKFISRAHRVDLYSTDVGVYYPLRDFSFKYIDRVYVISSDGLSYLEGKYNLLKGKLLLSRLGVDDNMRNHNNVKKDFSTYNIVSCSTVTPVKRVELIYKSLYSYIVIHPTIKIRWIHFGDGYLMPDLIKLIENTGKTNNFEIELKGNMPNEEILKDYQENVYHCFINLSESEGVPVSMMEAISSGIPLLGTNVGGTCDVVTSETGMIINANFTQSEFNEALTYILNNYEELSNSAHRFYLENYNSEKNYIEFYNSLNY